MASKFSPPGGERTLAAIITVVFGLSLLVIASPFWPRSLEYPRPAVVLVGVLLMAGGGLLWCRRGWARWPVAALVLGLAALTAGKLFSDGITLWRVAGPLALGWHAWAVLRHFSPQALADSDPGAQNGPMISLVLLLRRPRHLEANLVARYAELVWSTPFKAANEESAGEDPGPAHWVVGQSPLFMVSAPEGFFVVHNHDRPYFDEPEKLVADVHELRLRKVIGENRGWLAVDLMRLADAKAPRESAYPAIARFIAELAGPDCQAIFQPATDSFNPWDDALEAKLRSGDVADVFAEPTQIPVINVPEDDPRMVAAVAEARERWPEFVAAFGAKDGENFGVKAPVTVGDNTEFIWVQVDAIEGGTVAGKLGNEPVDLGDLREGSPVTVEVAELNDWAFLRNDEPVGLFTVKAIGEIQQERAAKREPSDPPAGAGKPPRP